MKRVTLLLAAILSGAFFLSGCQSTTAGGATNSSRSQLLLISSADVNEGAATAYKKELSQSPCIQRTEYECQLYQTSQQCFKTSYRTGRRIPA